MRLLVRRIKGKFQELLKLSPISGPVLKSLSFFLNPYYSQKWKIIQQRKISTVLDVGAHIGEYGTWLRHIGYQGKIVSFEPNPYAFQKLQKRAGKRPVWECHPFALGDKNEEQKINLLNSSAASSFLESTDIFHRDYNELANKIDVQIASIRTLDDVFSSSCNLGDSVFLKIDTQGYERKVLDGATECLKNIALIEFEVSFVALYKGESLIAEMIQFMDNRGFDLVGIHPHSHLPHTLRQYQADLLFLNRSDPSAR